MGTSVRPAKTSPGPWDAFADVDVFVDEVLAELAAMAKDSARPMRSGPKPPLAGAALRKAVMAIWCVCFCGMQWRAIGLLCDIRFGALYGLFARWTRLGLWRRLLNRLRRTWRLACRDTPEPSAIVIDSRSCRSAPSCFDRGIDGGKKIRGVKIHQQFSFWFFCLWQAFVSCSAARWAGSGRGSAHGGIGGGFAKARVSSRSSRDGKIR
jgi:hypothetical protein